MNRDSWNEILQLILRKPMRAFLAGIGVAWGIMMVLLMIGANNGLKNGIKAEMTSVASNSMFLWGGMANLPYKGQKAPRWVQLKNDDIIYLKENVPQIGVISPRNQLGGWQGSNNVNRKTKTGAFDVYGDMPEYIEVSPIDIIRGRYLNYGDIEERRKICVVGRKVQQLLFEEGEEVLGDYITINGVNFKVVGVFKSFKDGEDGQEEEHSIFTPFTTFQNAFNTGDRVGWISCLSAEGYSVPEMQEAVVQTLKEIKKIHPQDRRAFGHWNMAERMGEIDEVFIAMNYVGYVMGGLSLYGGMIVIVIIMLINVNDRTREFGVRRSLGARPISIISQVVKETTLLTVLSGLTGLVLGVGLIELIRHLLGGELVGGTFKNPEVSLSLVLMSLLFMIVVGIIAGFIPALRAVMIKPVDALRSGK
ncbi:MAG: ABC transporter permease [Flavobacteriales bacterium]|nr:ABC transporter permease [Flavobacteriales bacterium]